MLTVGTRKLVVGLSLHTRVCGAALQPEKGKQQEARKAEQTNNQKFSATQATNTCQPQFPNRQRRPTAISNRTLCQASHQQASNRSTPTAQRQHTPETPPQIVGDTANTRKQGCVVLCVCDGESFTLMHGGIYLSPLATCNARTAAVTCHERSPSVPALSISSLGAKRRLPLVMTNSLSAEMNRNYVITSSAGTHSLPLLTTRRLSAQILSD
jgi:hypothetical protein